MPNWDTVFSEVRKNSFIALPGEGGHSGLLPLKTVCPNMGGFGEEFLEQWLKDGVADKIGSVQDLHPLNQASSALIFMNSSGSSNPDWRILTPFICFFFSFVKCSKILLLICVSLEAERGSCPRLHYCFLTAPSFFPPYPLPSLISTFQICPLAFREGHGNWSQESCSVLRLTNISKIEQCRN